MVQLVALRNRRLALHIRGRIRLRVLCLSVLFTRAGGGPDYAFLPRYNHRGTRWRMFLARGYHRQSRSNNRSHADARKSTARRWSGTLEVTSEYHRASRSKTNVAYDSGSVFDFAYRLRGFGRRFVRARLARLPKRGAFVDNVRCRRVRPLDLRARAVFAFFDSSVAQDRGGSSVGTLLNAGVCGGRALRRVCPGELPVMTVTSNRAIDSDTLQAPLRALARARHRERYTAT